MLSIPAQAALVEEGRRHDHHREVDHAGERHRDHDVDLLEPRMRRRSLVVAAHDPALGERRVQVDDVRHHGGADDSRREQHALGAAEPGPEQVARNLAGGGVRVEDLEPERDEHDPGQNRDPGLEAPEAHLLETEDRKRPGAGDQRRRRTSGMPNSRLRPSAAPTTSAMSVDIATISA